MNADHSVPTVVVATVVTKAQVIATNVHLGDGVICALDIVSMNTALTLNAFSPMEHVHLALDHTGDQLVN